jgi:exosome complex component RRP41
VSRNDPNAKPYTERADGRGWNDTRPITAKAGVIPQADGSAIFTIGQSTAYAAVYGPREIHPKFLANPNGGVLRCSYNMQPFSGPGSRGRSGPSRRSKEISLVTQRALEPVVDLTEYPNTVVDVFIEFIETDAGSRCAGICAAAIALADAGITMRDMVAAVAVGHVDDQVLVDLNGVEEHLGNEVADIPVAMVPSTGEITLLQMDGITSKETLSRALSQAHDTIKRINQVQRAALVAKYSEESQ